MTWAQRVKRWMSGLYVSSQTRSWAVRGMTCQELHVGAQGLEDEPQMAAGRSVEGHGFDGPREVQRQLEGQPRLRLGLQEVKIHQCPRYINPAFGLEPLPDQLIGPAHIR
jgi:hypothetical protein